MFFYILYDSIPFVEQTFIAKREYPHGIFPSKFQDVNGTS